MIAARGELHPLGGVSQKPHAGTVGGGDRLDQLAGLRVAATPVEAERRVALPLECARRRRARRPRPPLARRRRIRSAAVTAGTSTDEVDTVEQRPGDARLVVGGAARSARAQTWPGSPAMPQRQGFIAAMSWKRDG